MSGRRRRWSVFTPGSGRDGRSARPAGRPRSLPGCWSVFCRTRRLSSAGFLLATEENNTQHGRTHCRWHAIHVYRRTDDDRKAYSWRIIIALKSPCFSPVLDNVWAMQKIVTFRVSRRRHEMYSDHDRLCVSVSVHRRIPTLLYGPGCNLGEWQGVPSSCALSGGFAIGARVLLLWQQQLRTRNVSECLYSLYASWGIFCGLCSKLPIEKLTVFLSKLSRSWSHKSTPLFTMRFSQSRLVRQIELPQGILYFW